MRYPKPTDRYSCEVLCENFMEVDERLKELEENGGGGSGTPGVGIESIEQTTTSKVDGGTNILTITTTDGDITTFEVKNGSTGSSGVYVGSGEMPDGYNIQIDPSGEVDGYYTKSEIDEMLANIGGSALPSAEEGSF